MEPNLSYDEMLEERIAADREVRIVMARLRATIVVVWRRCRRRPRAGALRREWLGGREGRRQILQVGVDRRQS